MLNTVTKITSLLLLVLCMTWISGCGFKPPKEYNNVAKAEPSDFQIPGEKTVSDGGDDDGNGEKAEVVNGKIHLIMGLTAIPAIPLSQLLAKPKETIEALFKPVEPENDEEAKILEDAEEAGWVKYSNHLRIRYLDDVSVEMEQQVPAGLSCVDAAKWLGFDNVKEPASEDDVKCEWPEGDAEHSLDEGCFGTMHKTDARLNAITTLPTPAE